MRFSIIILIPLILFTGCTDWELKDQEQRYTYINQLDAKVEIQIPRPDNLMETIKVVLSDSGVQAGYRIWENAMGSSFHSPFQADVVLNDTIAFKIHSDSCVSNEIRVCNPLCFNSWEQSFSDNPPRVNYIFRVDSCFLKLAP